MDTIQYLITIPKRQNEKFKIHLEDGLHCGIKLKAQYYTPVWKLKQANNTKKSREMSEHIIKRFTRKYKLNFLKDIATNSQQRRYIENRKKFISYAMNLGYSLASIGRALGRDHSTIIHCRNKYNL